MGRHLPAARSGIPGRSHSLEEHVFRGDAQSQSQRTIAIIREEPVVTWTECHARSCLQGFVPRPAHLKINLVLPLQENFPVVQAAGQIHDTECTNEQFPVQLPRPGRGRSSDREL